MCVCATHRVSSYVYIRVACTIDRVADQVCRRVFVNNALTHAVRCGDGAVVLTVMDSLVN